MDILQPDEHNGQTLGQVFYLISCVFFDGLYHDMAVACALLLDYYFHYLEGTRCELLGDLSCRRQQEQTRRNKS